MCLSAAVLTLDELIAVPSLTPSFDGNLLTQRHEIWPQQTRDSTLETLRRQTDSLYRDSGFHRMTLESVPGRNRQTELR